LPMVLDTKEWVKVLDALNTLQICQKDENLEVEGDFAYYFDLEDAIVIDDDVLSEIAVQLQARVSIITNDKGDPNTNDQLCIYFKEV
jgi:hypothetical protein